MQRTEWIKRTFPAIEDNGRLPGIIERLAGTTVRIREITRDVPEKILLQTADEQWTIKEHIGHLSDLEPLWLSRAAELASGTATLTAADMTNKKTYAAQHNNKDIQILIAQFDEQRKNLIARLQSLTDEELLHTSLHPRLQTMMRVVDLAYFVAEHDDHHLASMRVLF